MKKLSLEIGDVAELQRVVAAIQNEFSTAKIFLLKGNLGAGKTSFVKAFADVLQCKDAVQSPTYGIVNEYRTMLGESVFHFDLYRIKDTSELLDIGFEDYVYANKYCFIEWFEIAEKLLPEGCVEIQIRVQGDQRIFDVGMH
jgi:tRNA threonylcarbamoyladenosine biosynthesis protein TsaE